MAYCGKCGTKNPDGAVFCGGCGAKLVTAESNEAPQPTQQSRPQTESQTEQQAGPQTERVVLRPGSTLPPRRESAPGRMERPASQQPSAQGFQRSEQYNQSQGFQRPEPRSQAQYDGYGNDGYGNNQLRRSGGSVNLGGMGNGGFEKPRKKGGTLGGCLKRLGCGLLIFLIVVIGALWAIGTYFGDSDGGGGKKGNGSRGSDNVQYERVISESRLDSLMEKKSFAKDNGDVAVKAGRYTGSAFSESIVFDVELNPEGNIAGKVNVYMSGDMIRSCSFAYCGNGIYAMYHGERVYDNPDEYFQALPDHETIDWANGYRSITVKYTGEVPAEESKESDES